MEGFDDQAEAFELMSAVAEHCMQERFRYCHFPTAGELLVWDNHQIAHRSSPQQEAARGPDELRMMYRITTKDYLHALPPLEAS